MENPEDKTTPRVGTTHPEGATRKGDLIVNLVELEHVSKVYRTGGEAVKALDCVDFDVEKGEFVALMGPSGSGKSTLLSVIGALNSPTSGTVRIDGMEVYRLPSERLADFRREYVGFVFQQFHLISYLTAIENVMLPLSIASLSNRERLDVTSAALKRVGLSGKARRLPVELSGGEQERVAIARAIANEPQILLLDEPTGNLDSKTGSEIMDLFAALNEEGQTILMVTHNSENAARASRVALMADGKIVDWGTRPTSTVRRLPGRASGLLRAHGGGSHGALEEV